MKILLCCHLPLDIKLGGAKVYLEAARSYQELGHEVTIKGYTDIAPQQFHEISEKDKILKFPQFLKSYIESTNNEFDIIEFEYLYLPFKRSDLSTESVLVARSVLLIHHFKTIEIPVFSGLKGILGKLLKGTSRRKEIDQRIKLANFVFSQVDLISVPNDKDKEVLVESGIDDSKIIISPYGIFKEKVSTQKIDNYSKEIIFIGTFDNRKGAVEFPQIFSAIKKKYPEAKLKLLGTSSMFSDELSVLKFFPSNLQNSIKVVTKFDPNELNNHLKNADIGIFPSYIESFGFGALELMSRGIPVVSYDCPGPHSFIPKDLQCRTGDYSQMIKLAVNLLTDKDFKQNKAIQSLEIAKSFDWISSSRKALEKYKKMISSRV
jgi:glycosyltransferase involved in cell wall biosynthesis